MNPVTTKQIIAINTLLHKQGLYKHKCEIVGGVTNGRTESTKELFFEEAQALINDLNRTQKDARQNSRVHRKLFAMCHEMGWITEVTEADETGVIKKRKDYSKAHAWVLKYGSLKKELDKYTPAELPKLVSQLEKVYFDYLQGLSNNRA